LDYEVEIYDRDKDSYYNGGIKEVYKLRDKAEFGRILQKWQSNMRSEMSVGQKIPLVALLQSMNIQYSGDKLTEISHEEVDNLAKRVAQGFEEFLNNIEPVIKKLDYN